MEKTIEQKIQELTAKLEKKKKKLSDALHKIKYSKEVQENFAEQIAKNNKYLENSQKNLAKIMASPDFDVNIYNEYKECYYIESKIKEFKDRIFSYIPPRAVNDEKKYQKLEKEIEEKDSRLKDLQKRLEEMQTSPNFDIKIYNRYREIWLLFESNIEGFESHLNNLVKNLEIFKSKEKISYVKKQELEVEIAEIEQELAQLKAE